jgi:hypothetical protein
VTQGGKNTVPFRPLNAKEEQSLPHGRLEVQHVTEVDRVSAVRQCAKYRKAHNYRYTNDARKARTDEDRCLRDA